LAHKRKAWRATLFLFLLSKNGGCQRVVDTQCNRPFQTGCVVREANRVGRVVLVGKEYHAGTTRAKRPFVVFASATSRWQTTNLAALEQLPDNSIPELEPDRFHEVCAQWTAEHRTPVPAQRAETKTRQGPALVSRSKPATSRRRRRSEIEEDEDEDSDITDAECDGDGDNGDDAKCTVSPSSSRSPARKKRRTDGPPRDRTMLPASATAATPMPRPPRTTAASTDPLPGAPATSGCAAAAAATDSLDPASPSLASALNAMSLAISSMSATMAEKRDLLLARQNRCVTKEPTPVLSVPQPPFAQTSSPPTAEVIR